MVRYRSHLATFLDGFTRPSQCLARPSVLATTSCNTFRILSLDRRTVSTCRCARTVNDLMSKTSSPMVHLNELGGSRASVVNSKPSYFSGSSLGKACKGGSTPCRSNHSLIAFHWSCGPVWQRKPSNSSSARFKSEGTRDGQFDTAGVLCLFSFVSKNREVIKFRQIPNYSNCYWGFKRGVTDTSYLANNCS